MTSAAYEIGVDGNQPSPANDLQDLAALAASRALLWWPRHVASSPLLEQLPFLFWLMDVSRPRALLQIGLEDGVAYMALCQASERLASGMVSTGTEVAGHPMPAAMHAQHELHYVDFSQIFDADHMDQAVERAAAIDLLVLNQSLDPSAFSKMWAQVEPRLSDRAIILVCQPEKVFSNADVHDAIHAAGDGALTLRPVTAGGGAVEIILYGASQPAALTRLVAQTTGSPADLTTRLLFNRLGRTLVAVHALDGEQQGQTSLRTADTTADASPPVEAFGQGDMVARLSQLDQELAASKAEVAILKAELNDARAAHEERVADIAVLVRRFGLEKAKLRDALALLHKSAVDEIGRIAKALAPRRGAGLLSSRDISIEEQANLLALHDVVDVDWYRLQNPDVSESGMDPALHYLLNGIEEGRIPRQIWSELARLP